MPNPIPSPDPSRRHHKVAMACAAFAGVMVGAAYASVPLYDLFCRVTGFGGRPQIASSGPGRVIERSFEIRFDSNVNGALPWRFEPEARSVPIKAGEVKTILYRITNLSDQDTYGTASYNVTPMETGAFFSKVQCFCFSEQRLKAYETIELPVVFFVDPAIATERDLDAVATITLSYTFFPAAPPQTPVAEDERTRMRKL